jgi:hypothetical protein
MSSILIDRVYDKGRAHAIAQINDGKIAPDDELWIDIDPQDLLFALTGEKIDPESYAGVELLTEYEDGYYDEWDDHNG